MKIVLEERFFEENSKLFGGRLKKLEDKLKLKILGKMKIVLEEKFF